MALTTPILDPIIPFDASSPHTITFNVIGGDQVIGNTIRIKNASTGAQIFTGSVTSFVYSNTIPTSVLSNGGYYIITVQTRNAALQTSAESNPVSFYCYENPIVTPVNFSSGSTIANSNYDFQFRYIQAQSEPLQSYSINLYDASNFKIASSGIIYTASSTVPLTVSYEFNGMANATAYSIGLTGVTLHGMEVNLAPIPFTVQYETPAIYSLISLTNNCDGGYVSIQSNIQNINGTSYPSPPTYIGGEAVDLKSDGSYVNWSSGYNVQGDCTIELWVKNPTPNKVLFTQQNTNANNAITISYNVGYPQGEAILKGYFDLKVISGASDIYYYNFSNYITQPASTNLLYLFIRRVNNIYTITVENVGG